MPSDLAPVLPQAGAPDWVVVWESARSLGDTRLIAEQIPALAEQGAEIPTQPLSDSETWIQPGEYGYLGCSYDFASPVEHNRLCVWHPDAATRQPLERVVIGGMTFMCCFDCAEKSRRHDAEDPELQGGIKRAREWLVQRARRLIKRKLRPRISPPTIDPDDIPF